MTKKLFIFLMVVFIGFVLNAQENDLKNLTNYPYLQVPINQTLPAGKVQNMGSAAQTNVTLTVQIDGATVGTSAPLASLASGATAELPLTSAVNFPEGTHTISYLITQDETEETPGDNVYTFTIKGTSNLFVADASTASSSSYSNIVPASFGNIFEVTATTAITQVLVGFSTNITVNYSISIHSITNGLTIDPTPMFTQTASKNAVGFFYIPVPHTVLTPGRYFLCLNQLNNTSLGLQQDDNMSRSLYKVENNVLVPQNGWGAAAIRMITELTDCAVPSSLTAEPRYSAATCSWEGNALRYEVIVNNETTDLSFFTTEKSTTVGGLSTGTTYNWSVKALCDGLNEEIAAGTPFTTLNCGLVNNFPFEEGFEDNGNNLPVCWAHEQIVGATGWTVVPGGIGTPGGSHGGTSKARFQTSVKNTSARLITPPLNLSNLADPVLNFWHTQSDWGGDQDVLKVYYKTSAAGEWILLTTFDGNIPNWQKTQIELPDATDDYYIAFVGTSQYGYGIQLDDIQICGTDEPTDGHDLQNITIYPYSQVPASQILPPAQVKNVGFATETNVVLSVVLNGAAAGTSAPLVALAPGEVAELALAPAVHVPVGQNTMTYTVTQDQTDDTPENNVCTFTYKGTQTLFAVDDLLTCSNGASASPSIAMGHIFNITNTATLSQVVVGHGMNTYLEYSVSVYAMIDEYQTAATPIFTQPAIRNANGFNFITTPAIELTPGRYYLCANQLTGAGISVSYDNNPAKKSYLRASDGTLSEPAVAVGALAIRMVLEATDCVAQQPANLTVVPDYTTATFSWTGVAPLRFKLTLNDGNQDYTYYTTDNTFTVTGLLPGSSFTWIVTALCDAVHGTEATGTPFSTLSCDIIDTFTYQESFETNGTEFPSCWFQDHLVGAAYWEVVPGSTGTPATAHEGSFKALFAPAASDVKTRLIMPPMDLSGLNNPRLSFWHTQASQGLSQDILKVYYKTSATGAWTLLATYSENIPDWREELIELPNATANYYLAFEACKSPYVYGFGIQLDDISVYDFYQFIDGEIAQITAPNAGMNYELTANEQVKVIIKNNGSEPLTNFGLKLELNDIEKATETYTASIESMEQAEYTFTTTLDLSAAETYQIKVTALVNGDEVPENDTQTITVTNFICSTVTEFPFIEGFEGELFPPLCWGAYRLGAGTRNWERTTSRSHTGTASAYHNFVPAMAEGWLVTPAMEITENGNFILEFWSYNQWHDDNQYSGIWISTTGGDPATSTFTELKQLKNEEISASWKKIAIQLGDNYAGETIYIGFKYAGGNADNWFIDDVELFNFNNFTDGELKEILTESGEGLTSAEEVKVMIKNNGSNPLTGFELKLELNGQTKATETYTGSISSMAQAEYTFTTKIDLSAIATYDIKVTLNVAGDEAPENDSKTKKIGNFSPDVVELYGYRIFDEQDPEHLGFISFKSNQPNDITRVNDYMPESPANTIFAGEYVNGYFYAYAVNNGFPVNFVKISTETWTDVLTNPSGVVPSDMAYDYTTNVMYGIVRVEMDSYLVTINLETGAATSLGAAGKRLFTLACSPEGALFAIDASGNLCSVNKANGSISVIGHTGVSVNYVQTMSFDQNTGRLFWAMCNTSEEGKLLELDPATGIALNRGAIAGDAEIIGLYTQLGVIEQYIVTYNTPANGTLTVTANGTTIPSGTLVEPGTILTIDATPHPDYKLQTLTINGIDFENGTTYTVAADTHIECAFEALGISNNSLSGVKVYSYLNNVYIKNETSEALKAVEIYDMTGRIVYRNNITDSETMITLPVSSGIYSVRLISQENHILVKKITIHNK